MKKIGIMLVVFLMVLSTFIMPIFGATVPDYSPSIFASTYLDPNQNEAYTTYRVSSLQPYLHNVTYSIGDINGHDRIYVTYDIIQDYVITITIQNSSSHGNILIPTAQIQSQLQVPASSKPSDTQNERYFYSFKGWSIDNITGDIVSVGTSGGDNTSGYLQILFDSEYYNGGYILLPEGYKIHGNFVVHAHHTLIQHCIDGTVYQITDTTINNYFDCPASSFTFNSYNIQTNSDRSSHLSSHSLDQIEQYTSDIHDQLVSVLTNQNTIITNQNLAYTQRTSTNNYLSSIDSHVQTITDAYTSNSSNINDTQSNITDTDDLTSELHDQELTYYRQNEQALNDVGLSNFSFNSDQSAGLGTVVTDFTTLWNNIGPLQIIFTFTLSLSLATYLLRHRPITNAIKKNDKR